MYCKGNVREDNKIRFKRLRIYYHSGERGERLEGTNGTIGMCNIERGRKGNDETRQEINQCPFWRRGRHPGPRVPGDRGRDPCHFDHL